MGAIEIKQKEAVLAFDPKNHKCPFRPDFLVPKGKLVGMLERVI
jgi:hypothetical protein